MQNKTNVDSTSSIKIEEIGYVKKLSSYIKLNTAYTIPKEELTKEAYFDFYNPSKPKTVGVPIKGFAWIRMPNRTEWYRVYVRIEDSCIKVCKDISVSDFTYLYVIYNCEIDVMELKIKERSDGPNYFQVFMFKHTFDADYILVSFEDENYNDIKTTYKRLI